MQPFLLAGLNLSRMNGERLLEEGLPARRVQAARDYLLQDRLERRLRQPRTIAGRLAGYQDYYIPAARETPGGLALSCTCGRTGPCAHVLALLLAFVETPDLFLPADAVWVAESSPCWWPWALEFTFPWDRVPDANQWWLTAHGGPDTPPWDAIPAHQGKLHWLWANAAFVHPRRWDDESWKTALERVVPTGRLDRASLSEWIALQWRGPSIPLDRLWERVSEDLAHRRSDILRRLVATPADPDDSTAAARVLKMLDLLEIALGPDQVRWLDTLALNFDWADPHGLNRAARLDRAGLKADAVAVLESHLPKSRQEREPSRRLLIAFTGGDERLGHLVADALENPDPSKSEAIRNKVGAARYAELLARFPGLGNPKP